MASGGRLRIEPQQGRAQAGVEDHLGLGLAAQRARAVVELVIGVDRLPAQLRQQGDGRLLDQGVFGVAGGRGHEGVSFSAFARTVRPAAVVRYRCFELRGLSGTVISM